MTQTVFVTGATGFIATHVIGDLLQEGYKVIGTVRSKEKGDKLLGLFNNESFSYEIVKDLSDSKKDFDKALKAHPEIEIVLHTASPVFPKYYKDAEQDMILPAINGTRNVLESVAEFGKNVKRFVVTSSNSAIHSLNSLPSIRIGDPKIIENEDSWSDVKWEKGKKDINADIAYRISKKYAEKEVWDFAERPDVNFKVSVVNPVFVIGPQYFDQSIYELSFTSDLVGSLISNGNGEDFRKFQEHFIDVRDVSKAHLYAFQKENTVNKRLILIESPFTEQTLLDIINRKFPQLQGKIPKGIPGSDKESVDNRAKLDNARTREILGFQFISLEQSLYDTVNQHIKVKGTI